MVAVGRIFELSWLSSYVVVLTVSGQYQVGTNLNGGWWVGIGDHLRVIWGVFWHQYNGRLQHRITGRLYRYWFLCQSHRLNIFRGGRFN
jgi:hypothetical protein